MELNNKPGLWDNILPGTFLSPKRIAKEEVGK